MATKITPAGHFSIGRDNKNICIEATHVHSGLLAYTFSHLRFRTLKSAVQFMTEIETCTANALETLKSDHTNQTALRELDRNLRSLARDHGCA